MVGANFNYQFIDWGHDKIPNSGEEFEKES